MPGYFAKKKERKFEKHAKNRQFHRKTSPSCVGRKIQQNDKSVRKSNNKAGTQIRKSKPKMNKFSNKHAQYMPLSVNWNSKSAIKFEKKQSAKQKSAKKQANFN